MNVDLLRTTLVYQVLYGIPGIPFPVFGFRHKNTIHLQLTKMGEGCHVKVKQWLADGGAGNIKSIGKLRSMARNMLKDELSEIDVLVKQILE